jgi:hypothetical protein
MIRWSPEPDASYTLEQQLRDVADAARHFRDRTLVGGKMMALFLYASALRRRPPRAGEWSALNQAVRRVLQRGRALFFAELLRLYDLCATDGYEELRALVGFALGGDGVPAARAPDTGAGVYSALLLIGGRPVRSG